MRQFAFLSDTGDPSLGVGRRGVSSHYTLTAVIVTEGDLATARAEADALRRKYFRRGTISSERVGSNHARRLRVLGAVEPMNVRVLAFVVDKARLARAGGFHADGPFLKFLSARMYRQLSLAAPDATMIADSDADESFMAELADCLTGELQPSLFQEGGFTVVDSASEPLVQLSHFIGATIAKGFRPGRRTSHYNDFIGAIEEKLLAIKVWPGGREKFVADVAGEFGADYDSAVADCAVRLAQDFVDLHEDDPLPIVRMRVTFLEHLLFRLSHANPSLYVPTQALLDHIQGATDRRPSDIQLRAEVVGPLRDDGVLIASSANGYKIPISEKELRDFIGHGLAVIAPMVARLQRCREQIRVATGNELDILDHEEYALLRKLTE